MDISVVIPVLNMMDTVADQLRALAAQDFDGEFEVIVVDNGSTDGTFELVRSLAGNDGRFRLVDGSRRPRGGAGAKNLGVESSRADLVAFCDADDIVGASWLRVVYHALLKSPVVTTRIENWSLNPHLRTDLVSEFTDEYRVFSCTGIPGGAFGIHRDVYRTVGGFDEYFAGASDSEFAARVDRAGYRVTHLTDAVVSVRHRDGAIANLKRSYRGTSSHLRIRDLHGFGRSGFSVRLRSLFRRLYRLVRAGRLLLDPAGRNTWAQRLGVWCTLAVDLIRHPGARPSSRSTTNAEPLTGRT